MPRSPHKGDMIQDAVIRRRFVSVGDRQVQYLRAGQGAPVVLVHSSPADATMLTPEIRFLSRNWTVFALDTPGFGQSDPLPLAAMTVADLADALADTLAALGVPRCPMFGTHTGAAIALEFGVRHPDRVTGLVLDGVPMFTVAEAEAIFAGYFRALPVSDLGGHYAETWTRFRDQAIWFPWWDRRAGRRNGYDLGPAASTHRWVSMYFDAADHYAPAYRAACGYGERAIVAAEALACPAIYTATDTDMLHPHLDRLPPLGAGQERREIGGSPDAKHALIAEGFARFGSPGAAPGDRATVATTACVARQFVDAPDGRQWHLRHAGDRLAPALLLIHDAPGSSALHDAAIRALSAHAFVVAPDLPGHGFSAPLAAPSVADFADDLRLLLDLLGTERVAVLGIGFGASVAIELAARHPAMVRGLAIEGLLLADPVERATLAAGLAPPISIEPDGSHWYRTWSMLRDGESWWPWFDRRVAAIRRNNDLPDAGRLHRRTIEVMRAADSYADLVDAALVHDAAAALARLDLPVLGFANAGNGLDAYDARLAGVMPMQQRHVDPAIHAAILCAAIIAE